MSNNNQDSTIIENIQSGKISSADKKLFGEWTVQLSCDGSIMCNVCPKISFSADGFGSTTNAMEEVQNFRWEMLGDKIKISNFAIVNIVDNGVYEMTYWTNKNIFELQLTNAVNSNCYSFIRVTSN